LEKSLNTLIGSVKKIFLLFLILTCSVAAQAEISNISIKPGAFGRMGFGARGKGMGNAMSSVIHGNIVSYYNPALNPFQYGNSFQTSYSFLSLDRSLNFLSFTKNFEFGKMKDSSGNEKPRSVAGLSIGLINSGVGNIQERDNQGNVTGDISTSENLAFLGLSTRFSEKVSIGVTIKFFYYKLYEDITSTGLGLDAGVIYLLNDNITFSFLLSDLNSKYKWDSNELYGQNGSSFEEKFPVRKTFGMSYKFDNPNLIVSAEIEKSNAETTFIRFGSEYNVYQGLYIRAGMDNWNLENSDFPARPSAGFSYFYSIDNLKLGIDYAFVIEPYSSSDQHIVGVTINF
jgi:hypothetical protein